MTEIKILKANLLFLKFHQIWPYGNDQKYFFTRVIIVLLTTCPLWLGTIFHLKWIINEKINLSISKDITMLIAAVGLHMLIIFFSSNQRKLQDVFETMSDFERFGKPRGFEKLNKTMNFWSTCYYIYCSSGYTTLAYFRHLEKNACETIKIENGIANEACGLFQPAQAPFDFNLDRSPAKEILLFVQYYAGYVLMVGGATTSFALFVTIEHMVLRVQHMNFLIYEVFQDSNADGMKEKLLHCLRYHQFIIDVAGKMRYCFQNCTFVHLTLNALMFAVIGHELITESSAIAIAALLHLSGWVTACLVVFTSGQHLINASLSISDAVYNTNWYEGDVECQKIVLLLMMRSQKEMHLEGVPFGMLSFPTLLGICKASYSYLTLLNRTV